MKRTVMALVSAGVFSSAASGQEPAARLATASAALAEAFESRDAEAIASHFAVDGIAHYPGLNTPVLGRDANQRAWVNYYRHLDHHPLTTDSLVVSASGDVGYTIGRYLLAAEDDPEATGGRYVAVWRVVEGEWKIAVLAAHQHADVNSSTFQRPTSTPEPLPPAPAPQDHAREAREGS